MTCDAAAVHANGPQHASAVRGRLLVVALAAAVGMVSFLSNITSTEQLSGQADVVLAARWSLSRIVNAGAVWAGLSVAAGYFVRSRWAAAVSGAAAPTMALLVHYSAGAVTGWLGTVTWAGDNLTWFAAAALLGPPLGLIGYAARRPTGVGMAAALVVPAGAVLRPIVLGTLRWDGSVPWPNALAGLVSSVVLIVAGVAGVCVIGRMRLPRSSG
ncbi:unannotated protein [freshwater metagenome]|uniref:Unannotated protein n=1 Tax=freshwater metagenome TaxID=449393 RepID=A0A6J7F0S2_9ZZZZ|nr:hypothetical protein [Actinomycetota bacterium]